MPKSLAARLHCIGLGETVDTLVRIFLATAFCVAAAYTQLAWGDDAHFEFAPIEEADFDLGEEDAPREIDTRSIEVPVVERKPEVPLLFQATHEILQSWKVDPTAPPPADRSLASTADVAPVEASVGGEIPETYEKILSAIQSHHIAPEPVRDHVK